jgi:hypothetical protein
MAPFGLPIHLTKIAPEQPPQTNDRSRRLYLLQQTPALYQANIMKGDIQEAADGNFLLLFAIGGLLASKFSVGEYDFLFVPCLDYIIQVVTSRTLRVPCVLQQVMGPAPTFAPLWPSPSFPSC